MATEYECIMVLDDGETYSVLEGCKVLMVPKEDLDNADEKLLHLNGYKYDKVMEFSSRFLYVNDHTGLTISRSGSISVRLPDRFSSD